MWSKREGGQRERRQADPSKSVGSLSWWRCSRWTCHLSRQREDDSETGTKTQVGRAWKKKIWGLQLTWETSNICSAGFQRWFHPVAPFCFARLHALIKMSTDSTCCPRPPQLHPFQQWMAWVWEDKTYPSGYEQMEMTCTPQRLLHRLLVNMAMTAILTLGDVVGMNSWEF